VPLSPLDEPASASPESLDGRDPPLERLLYTRSSVGVML